MCGGEGREVLFDEDGYFSVLVSYLQAKKDYNVTYTVIRIHGSCFVL